MAARVGILADDLSGATALAAEFARVPMPSFVTDCWKTRAAARMGAEVIAVNTRTRYATPQRASRVAGTAARCLRRSSPDVVIKKIDSMLRGPMGTEIDAIFEVFGFGKCVLVAASPSQGRTTIDAVQLSDGRPIAELMGQEDPAYSLGTSHVPTVLAAQCRRPTGRISLDTVRAGPDAIGSAIARDEAMILVADCASDSDMAAIVHGAWNAGVRFFAGTYGLGGAIVPLLRPRGRGGPVLVVAGSMSATTRTQVECLLRRGSARHIALQAGLAFETGRRQAMVAAWRSAIASALGSDGVAVVTTACDAEDRERLRRCASVNGWTDREAASEVERLMCEVLREVVALASAVVATGGATAEALLEAIGASAIEVEPLEVLPGSPLARVRGGKLDGLRFLTKPGSFGGRDGLDRMVSFLLQPAWPVTLGRSSG